MKLGLANQLLNRLILPVCLIQIFQFLPQTFHSLCMLLLLYTCLSFGDIIRERVSGDLVVNEAAGREAGGAHADRVLGGEPGGGGEHRLDGA